MRLSGVIFRRPTRVVVEAEDDVRRINGRHGAAQVAANHLKARRQILVVRIRGSRAALHSWNFRCHIIFDREGLSIPDLIPTSSERRSIGLPGVPEAAIMIA